MIQVEQSINPSSYHKNPQGQPDSAKYSSRSAPLVEKIRQRFFDEEWPENSDLYCEKDIRRVKESEWFVKRFLLASRRNVDEAYEMLKTTLRWRRKFNLPEIKPEYFPKEFYEIGGLFSYEPDCQGNPVIYLRIRMHKKIKEIHEPLQQFLFYTIDRVDQETDSNGCVLVFDCNGAGYSNMDLDLLKSLVDVSFKYFPFCIRYIIVYELSWMLNAFRRIAMTFVPSTLARTVRFANKTDIQNFIPKENLPDFMGGTCERNYRQIPNGCRTVLEIAHEHGFTTEDAERIMAQFEPLLKESREAAIAANKDKTTTIEYSMAAKENDGEKLVGDNHHHHQDLKLKDGEPFVEYDMVEANANNVGSEKKSIAIVHSPASKSFQHIATIYPQNMILLKRIRLDPFSKPEKEKNSSNTTAANSFTMAATIMIRNNHHSNPLAFKIQCNHSDRYSVTPNQGLLFPQAYISIRIMAMLAVVDHHDHHVSATELDVGNNPVLINQQKNFNKKNQDKFLILLSTAVDVAVHLKNSNEFNKLFIQNDINQIYVHKLLVQLDKPEDWAAHHREMGVAQPPPQKQQPIKTLVDEMNALNGKYQRLEQRQWWLSTFLLGSLVIILVLIGSISFVRTKCPA